MAGFKDLPVEMRSAIWAACLSNADVQGIYFFDPEDFGMKDQNEDDDEDWEVEREVTVAFPAIMHVCHESRQYAKSHLSFTEDPATGASVPSRPYRPATDVFYVPHRHYDDKFVTAIRKAEDDKYHGKLPQGNKSFSREIAHLAFSSQILMTDGRDELQYLLPEMTALRRVSFVFGNTDALDWSRPLALAGLTNDVEPLAPGKPRTKVRVEDTLDDLMSESAFWEVADEDTAPRDGWTGEWLFEMEAKKMERIRGMV
ncbi:hypothetical protein Daus18300_004723 [Diaporthe australafricana]|uniref:2EXR domain-containing protein n=1 Tax=Diaporthe australafricana TaxID=127596 RepID=A0ABR3X6P5_9PEZI